MEINVFDEIKKRVDIVDVITHFHTPLDHNNKALCPFHREKTPSFSVDPNEQMFKCFGCGVGGDSITFVAKLKELSQIDAAKLIDSEFRLGLFDCDKPKKNPAPMPKVSKKKEPEIEDETFEPDPSIKGYLKQCIEDVNMQDYMEKVRGFTPEMIKRFKIGYDKEKNGVTIPYSSKLEYYQMRYLFTKGFYKPEKEKAGPEPVYNKSALELKTRTPIFLVESPICAMSIMGLGGTAIAIGGCGVKKLIDTIKKQKPKGALVLCLDNDETGQKTTKELIPKLKEINVKYLQYNICPGYKDPNEMFVDNKDALKNNILLAEHEAQKLTATPYDLKSGKELQHKILPPTRWIIKDFMPAGLSLLTAGSKIGKSWMSMQMCINILFGEKFLKFDTVKGGSGYFALEDNEKRIQERMNKFLKGRECPDNFFYSLEAPTLDCGLMDILELQIAEKPSIKLIIIDTLQKVRGTPPRNENAYTTDYRELGMLKKFADKHQIAVLLVHHFRKQMDQNDVFNQINGSNGMMGVVDSSYVIYKKHRMDEEATVVMTGRDIVQQEFAIKVRKEGGWEFVGSAEEQEARMQRERLQNNPLIKLIKKLLEAQPSGWRGTAKQLKEASLRYGTVPILQGATAIGKELSSITYDLEYYEGIMHIVPNKRTREGTVHEFYLKNKYTGQPIKKDDYQLSTFEENT